MKKFSKKGVLLFAAATAVCAFTMPSMASASSWGIIGSTHTLDSPNLGFVIPALSITSTCGELVVTVEVRSAALMTVTNATFGRCTATGAAIGSCTKTWIPTGLPWTATAVTTTNIQLHGIHVDVAFENHPGSTACTAAGLKLTITGTISNGHWTGNGVNQHELIANDAPGLVFHSALGNNIPLSARATFRDTQQTLIVTG